MTIEVRLHGAQGTRTQAITPTGFPTRHINRATETTPSQPVKVTPDLPIPPVSAPAPVSTEAPRHDPVCTPSQPAKMPIGSHQNDRFLNGISATLKISGKWETPQAVFRQFYNKYDLANTRDIEIGLEILASANEIESKETDGGTQYLLTTSEFETVLNRCQVSPYHLAEVTGIDETVMTGYYKGVMISAADAQTIADKLNIDLSEMNGMCEPPKATKQTLQSLLAEVDAIMGVQNHDA